MTIVGTRRWAVALVVLLALREQIPASSGGGTGSAWRGCHGAVRAVVRAPTSSGPAPASAQRRAQARGRSGRSASCARGTRRPSRPPRRRARRRGRSQARRSPAGPAGRRLRRQHGLRVRAAAVIRRDHPAVVRRVAVGADTEDLSRAGRPGGRRTHRSCRPPGPGERAGSCGPCSLVYQRRTASSRPIADSTRARRTARSARGAPGRRLRQGRPAGTAMPVRSSAPPARRPRASAAGTSRSSSGGAGRMSPTPRSPGRSRSRQGTQSGARIASGPGSSTTLAHGDRLRPRRPGHGDRPPPAPVGRVEAGEQVGDDPVRRPPPRRGARRRRRRPAISSAAPRARSTACAQTSSGSRVRVRSGLTFSNCSSSLVHACTTMRPDRASTRLAGPIRRAAGNRRILLIMGWDGRWAASRAARRGRLASAAQSGARAGASAARGTGRVVQRMTRASGAGRTGLANLIELTAAGAAPATPSWRWRWPGTLFFSASVDEARGTGRARADRHHGAVRGARPADRADAGPGRRTAAATSWRARCWPAGCCAGGCRAPCSAPRR